MTSFVNFTPIIGANEDDSACCYLLEIDDSKLLLDCGWDFKDPVKLANVAKIAHQVDAVLLSHADFDHCGGYAYAVAKLGLDCPTFATTPVHDMGLQLMQDSIASKLQQTELQELNLEQVNRAFGKITLLRYSQPYTLSGKCAGIVITAFGAGHTVGGTIWKIKKDNEDIVYAVDFNHRKESHLNGTVLLSSDALSRPSLFITASREPSQEVLTRKTRDEKMIATLTESLARGGSVLIPVQTSTRVLELAFTLEEHWKKDRLSFHLVFLSHQSQSTIVYAKSMLEWMGDSISQSFQTRDQPFDFRYLKCIQSLDEMSNLTGPKVVLASFPGLDFGIGQELLLEWAGYANNCIVFPERPPVDSLGWRIFSCWKSAEDSSIPVPLNLDIPLTLGKRAPLEGEELEEYLLKEKLEEEERAKDPQQLDLDDLSDSDEENEEVGGAATGGVVGVPVYDIYVRDHVTRKGFFKQSQAFRMYPVYEVRNRVDEYGEVVDLSFYSKFEQKVPEDDYDMDIEMPKPEEVIVKETPSKYIVENRVLSLRCLVFYIDFEGKSDSLSLQNIIQQLSPRKVMLVHGSQKATAHLAEFCMQNEDITNEVFSPTLLERVTVSTATNLFQVVLTDALVSSLRLTTLNDYNLAYVAGKIKTQEGPNGPQLFLEALDENEKKQRKSVTVGDISLRELKKHLTQQGFTAQFAKGGILVVNGAYVIQKNAQGGLSMNGRIHQDYYKLRSIVYNLNAMLA